MPLGRSVRVLWLSKETPDKYGQGGQRRQFFQIRELTRADVSVTVLVPRGDQDPSSVRRLADVRFLPNRVSRLVRGQGLTRTINSGTFDALAIAHGESFELLRHPDGPLGLPSVLDFHNVNSRWYEVLADDEKVDYWQREEHIIASSVSEMLACSQRDLDALPTGFAGRALAPNGVDLAEWPLVEAPSRVSNRLAAFGSWWYPSNRKGIEWFVRSVWPEVRRRVPTATLQLAGSGDPPEEVVSAEGIEYVGRVPDIAGFLQTANAIVMPVLDSPGTPVKFAEALASGTPLISTTEAAEGFPDAPASATNDPQEFAERCISFLHDSAAVRQAAKAGREFAEASCQWHQTQQPLLDWAGRLAAHA